MFSLEAWQEIHWVHVAVVVASSPRPKCQFLRSCKRRWCLGLARRRPERSAKHRQPPWEKLFSATLHCSTRSYNLRWPDMNSGVLKLLASSWFSSRSRQPSDSSGIVMYGPRPAMASTPPLLLHPNLGDDKWCLRFNRFSNETIFFRWDSMEWATVVSWVQRFKSTPVDFATQPIFRASNPQRESTFLGVPQLAQPKLLSLDSCMDLSDSSEDGVHHNSSPSSLTSLGHPEWSVFSFEKNKLMSWILASVI